MNVYRKIRQSIWLEALLIAIGLGVHLYYLFHTTFVDWSEMLLYPWFLTKGLVYYRDVVLAYVPGAYYLLYALYSVLGFSPWSERLIAYGFILITDVLVYLVTRRVTGNKWAALAGLLFFILWQPVFSGNTIWYETVLAPIYLVSYLLALRYLTKPDTRNAVYLGLSFAVASLIKQTAIWPIMVIALFVWFGHKDKRTGFSHAFIVGILPIAANAAVWGYFALLGAGREFGYWSYGFLSALTRSNSYYLLAPTRSDIVLITPALLPFSMFVFGKQKREVWLIMFWAVALFLAGLPRWGIHRLEPMLVFASVGFGVMLNAFSFSRKPHAALLGYALLFVISVGSWRSFRVFITVRDHMQPQFFGNEYQRLLDFGRTHLDQPYYVLGNYDYLYYGLGDRPAVLPWVPLFPWNAQVAGVQEQLIASLEAQEVPYILYIPFHPQSGYYLDYVPSGLLLYVSEKYEKIRPLPVEGGWLYQRK